MKVRETNTRTGESHIYDREERQKEIEENHKNKMLGYSSPFREIQNGDIILQEVVAPTKTDKQTNTTSDK